MVRELQEQENSQRLQDTENYNARINNRPEITLEAQNMPDMMSTYDPEANFQQESQTKNLGYGM